MFGIGLDQFGHGGHKFQQYILVSTSHGYDHINMLAEGYSLGLTQGGAMGGTVGHIHGDQKYFHLSLDGLFPN